MVEDRSGQPNEDTEGTGVRRFCGNGNCMKAAEVEAKLDRGHIKEAESSLCEGLSLHHEESRALLGRLEYQRGNLEGALHVFDDIDLHAAIQRLRPSFSEKSSSKKGRLSCDVPHSSQQAATLILEALYLKTKSLQKLGRINEAARECTSVLDAVEDIFQQGIPDVQVESRLQETVSQAVELLPELLKKADKNQEAVSAYRRALLSQWNLDNDCCARIQMAFAVFLLYSGVEAGTPSLGLQIEGSFVPKNNLEEAILLLMILVKKNDLGKIKWDPSVMEHLTYALSLCSQTSVLAKQFEVVLPGVFHRVDRWNNLALCYSGFGQNKAALNLLRKSLHKHERPNDLMALLLAAKICSEDSRLADEGVGYARRAISNVHRTDGHLKGVGLRVLGLCLGKQATVSSCNFERSKLLSEALKSLEGAISFEHCDPELIFELGIQYAEQRNLNVALRYAKKYIDATGGSTLKGWRLLALVLSAQRRFSEAEVVTDAALDESAKWEQGPLLRLKAKLQISQSKPADAIETYRCLLALVQAQRKSFGHVRSAYPSQVEDDTVSEFEVWHCLANLYSGLSHWKDVEICLAKARELKRYSPELMHREGAIHQERGETREALSCYLNAVLVGQTYVPCDVSIGALLSKVGASALPVARTFLSDGLRIEPTNRDAWFNLGIIHKNEGRIADAVDCFQAASMLEESDPIESFSSLL